MSEEIKEVHIKSYDEWLKYYENATKEQVIEDLTQDVKYFADAVKDIKYLQEENESLNNIINELEKYIRTEVDYIEFVVDPILDKLQELKGSNDNG